MCASLLPPQYRDSMKLRSGIIIFSLGIASAVLGYLWYFHLRPRPLPSEEIILEQVKTISVLESTEFLYQFVFPYDFLPDQKTITLIGQGRFPLNNLPPLQQRAYRIAERAGLTGGLTPSFVVITSIVRAGIDFLSSAPVTVERSEDLSTVLLSIPQPDITRVIIEDIDENYAYPRISVDAEEWKEISEFVREQARSQSLDDGIVTRSMETLKKSLSTVLHISGFQTVEITFHDH